MLILCQILEDLIYFVLKKSRSSSKSENCLTLTGHPDKDRQKLMREQNILLALFDILKSPFTEDACPGCDGSLITDLQ